MRHRKGYLFIFRRKNKNLYFDIKYKNMINNIQEDVLEEQNFLIVFHNLKVFKYLTSTVF